MTGLSFLVTNDGARSIDDVIAMERVTIVDTGPNDTDPLYPVPEKLYRALSLGVLFRIIVRIKTARGEERCAMMFRQCARHTNIVESDELLLGYQHLPLQEYSRIQLLAIGERASATTVASDFAVFARMGANILAGSSGIVIAGDAASVSCGEGCIVTTGRHSAVTTVQGTIVHMLAPSKLTVCGVQGGHAEIDITHDTFGIATHIGVVYPGDQEMKAAISALPLNMRTYENYVAHFNKPYFDRPT